MTENIYFWPTSVSVHPLEPLVQADMRQTFLVPSIYQHGGSTAKGRKC